MDNYEKLEEELKETKVYTKRVIDLWADAKKWKMLAKMTDNDEDYNKALSEIYIWESSFISSRI